MMRYTDIDWKTWSPVERATLLFVIRDSRVLLIRKKRGLGAGKINAPGGRLTADETSYECAVRETEEEILATPLSPRLCGELLFQFIDGHSLRGLVYRSADLQGAPQSTPEADPAWYPIDCIPYGDMWMDDRLWIPLMLSGRYFTARFLFDEDILRGCEIETSDPPRRAPF